MKLSVVEDSFTSFYIGRQNSYYYRSLYFKHQGTQRAYRRLQEEDQFITHDDADDLTYIHTYPLQVQKVGAYPLQVQR